MAEDFVLSELIIPGTYIRVSAEALIGVGGLSTGNIGIVGTAADGIDTTHLLSGYQEAAALVGTHGAFGEGAPHLSRALQVAYRSGAGLTFARPVAVGAQQADFEAAFAELLKDDVNILLAPELDTETALGVLGSVVDAAESDGRDVIAVVGSDADTRADIIDQVTENDRIIFCAPGIRVPDVVAAGERPATVDLPGTWAAPAVAGLISTLAPQSSPTNKVVPGLTRLAQRFSYGDTVQLVDNNVLVLEERRGVRVVRGLTTDPGPFRQITTRRITDYAKAGIREASDPFIGRLNNERVRKALRGAIDGFLTTMLVDEALTAYELSVTATRQDEIAGRAVVNAVLQPTFSIDFVAVTLVLQ
jgi:hypothetical protein